MDIWTFPEVRLAAGELIGFDVVSLDGPIGRVDEASSEIGSGYLIVDTGSWISGKKVMLPAGLVEQVDAEGKRVVIGRTRDQIEGAPELNSATYLNTDYHRLLADYYQPG